MQDIGFHFVSRLRFTLILSCSLATSHSPALAQTAGQPVGQGSGPLSELSTNVGAGSGSVRDSNGRPGINPGRLGGNSVRGSVAGDIVSGPVSDISVGSVGAGRTVTGGGSVGQASVGAVKKDIASPLGEMISEPLRELGPLQDQLRALQPLPRNGSSPDEVAPPAEDAAGTDDTADSTSPHQEPAEETDLAEGSIEPEATPEPDDHPDDQAQEADDASDAPAATPTASASDSEPQ